MKKVGGNRYGKRKGRMKILGYIRGDWSMGTELDQGSYKYHEGEPLANIS